MVVKFKVVSEHEEIYGTFSKLEDAREIAQEMADEYGKDLYIKKITSEIVECIMPVSEDDE